MTKQTVTYAEAVRLQYLPAWARLRRLAAFERIAGRPAASLDLLSLARHVREEMSEPRPAERPPWSVGP